MNRNVSDVKPEVVPDCVTEIKLELEDIKPEREECNIKDEMYSSSDYIKSEVKEQTSGNCGNRSQVIQLNTEEEYCHISYNSDDSSKDESGILTNDHTGGKSNARMMDECSHLKTSHSLGMESVQENFKSKVSDNSLHKSNKNMKVDIGESSVMIDSSRMSFSDELPVTESADARTDEKPNKSYVKEHTLTNTNEKSFKCIICSKTFSERSSLRVHMCTHTNEKIYECSICNKLFSSEFYFDVHTRSHTKERLFKCGSCTMSFKRKFHLLEHIRSHTNEKPFKCNICSKSFSRKYNCVRHTRSHTNGKPFQCSLCTKSFTNEYYLNVHKPIHTNGKSFECNFCSMLFSRKWHLSEHIRTHTNEKPFKCSICSKSFSSKSNLTRHTPLCK